MSAAPIRLKLIYNRKKQLNSQGKALLQVRATKDRIPVYFSTGIELKPEQWNEAKEEIIGLPDKIALNLRLQNFKRELQQLEAEGSRYNTNFSAQDLKDAYLQKDRNTTSFTGFALSYLEQTKGKYKPATYTKYKNSVQTFAAFNNGNVEFSELTHPLIDRFFAVYLPSKGKPAGGNTQAIYLRHLRFFAKEAEQQKLLKHEDNALHTYNRTTKKIKTTKVKRDWLEPEELAKLEAYQIPPEKEHWHRVRDFYLFMCYTGLRFQDAANLSAKHIRQRKEGLELHTEAIKTGKAVTLPLYLLFPDGHQEGTRPERLLYKYWKDKKPFFSTTKTGGGEPNNQHVNREIKAIAAAAGITGRHLTNHTARHTFASFLITRVPITVVRDLLQHGKIETTMIYAHTSRETINHHLRTVKDWS